MSAANDWKSAAAAYVAKHQRKAAARRRERTIKFNLLHAGSRKRLRGSIKFGGFAPIFAIGFTDRHSFIFLFWCLHCGITWDY